MNRMSAIHVSLLLAFLLGNACSSGVTEPSEEFAGSWKGIIYNFGDIEPLQNELVAFTLNASEGKLEGEIVSHGYVDTLQNIQISGRTIVFEALPKCKNCTTRFTGVLTGGVIEGTYQIVSFTTGSITDVSDWFAARSKGLN